MNCHNLFDAAAGFGGYRESWFGRDGGKEVREVRAGGREGGRERERERGIEG